MNEAAMSRKTGTEAPEPEALLDTEGAARMLGISPRTVQGWVRQKRIPHIKLSEGRTGLTRFRASDLRAWIAARVVGAEGTREGTSPEGLNEGVRQ